MNPHWSPDGTQILFSDGITAKIYSVSPEDARPRRLLSEDDEIVRDPDWSPDGKKLVFARGDFRDEKNEDLRIADLAGHQVSAIPGSTGLYDPSWSPDGRFIAAVAFDKSPLRVFDVKTQNWRTLSTNGSATFPTFSRDSQHIYFLRYGNDQGVFRIGVNGEKLERVADLTNMHLTGFWGFSFSLDPTDATIVTRDVGTDDIYALTLEAQ
jgi:Tol biopolymer transport system component